MSEPISTVEQLVAARDARGLSPEDVLRQLKLAPRQLRAIETGDWEALPGAAFTRAVLRSYGRILDANVEPLLASISPSVPPAALKPASSLDTPLPSRSMLGFGSGGGGSRLAWVALVLLAVVALALFFGGGGDLANVRSWLSELRGTPGSETPAGAGATGASPQTAAGDSTTQPAAQSPTQKGAPGSSAADAAAGTAGSPPVGETASDKSSAGGARTASGEAKPPSAPLQTGPTAVAPPAGSASAGAASATGTTADEKPQPGPAETAKPAGSAAERVAEKPAEAGELAGRRMLRLRFERESWIEVKAADGTVLAIGTQPAQSSREISGAGPLSVVIGNAQYVRAEVDGKAFDLAPHTRAAIARVSIP